MFRLLATIGRWIFSRTAAVIILWVVVLGATALYVAAEYHFSRLPERRQALERDLDRYRSEIGDLDRRMADLDEALKERLQEADEQLRERRALLAERTNQIQELQKQLKQLQSILERARDVWLRLTGEDPEKRRDELTRQMERQRATREAEAKGLTELIDNRRQLDANMSEESRNMAAQRAAAEQRAAAAEREVSRLDVEITRWESRKAAALTHLSEAFRRVGNPLIVATLAILLFPLVGKAVLYYLWAPLAARGRPVIITSEADAPIRVSETAVAQEIVLGPGESAVIQHRFYQASDEDLAKRTQFFLDWRYPFTSLACWLILLTRVTNRAKEHTRRLTLSSQDEAQIEMTVVEIPQGGSLVCRPSFLAALIVPGGKPPLIRSHWRIFSLHAWITLQFRYFEFRGPVRLVLWAYRGVRAERLTRQNVEERNVRRTNQLATIGFTPSLRYRSRRAETFFSYLRNQNPLFDDLFSGVGVFLCQQISRSEEFRRQGRFWAGLWNGVTKVFGL